MYGISGAERHRRRRIRGDVARDVSLVSLAAARRQAAMAWSVLVTVPAWFSLIAAALPMPAAGRPQLRP
jgi:hypothetical protein